FVRVASQTLSGKSGPEKASTALVIFAVDSEQPCPEVDERTLSLGGILAWVERAAEVGLRVQVALARDHAIDGGAVAEHRSRASRVGGDVAGASPVNERDELTVTPKQMTRVAQAIAGPRDQRTTGRKPSTGRGPGDFSRQSATTGEKRRGQSMEHLMG